MNPATGAPERGGQGVPLRHRPTRALVTSATLAAALVPFAVVLHRSALLLLAAPFVVHLVRALARRPGPGAWRSGLSSRNLTEGETVRLWAEAAPGQLVTVAATPSAQQRFRPGDGASTGAGRASVQVEPLRWGRHDVGPAVLESQDPSGAWRSVQRLEQAAVRVRPRSAVMAGGSGVKQPLGIQGEHLSAVRGEGTEIAEVREFRPGDRLRRITWRVSSRTVELHVVDALTERDTDVLLVLDSERPAQELGDDPASSLDVAAGAIVALARHYVGFGDRVGLHDLGHRTGHLPLGSGPRQLVALTELLSRTQRGQGGSSLALRRTPTPRAGALVFVCTPLLDEEVLTELGRLRRCGAELVVVDTLPASLGARATSPRAATSRDPLADVWRLRVARRQAQVDALQRNGIPVAAWNGPASLAAVLLAMERSRSLPRMVRR